MEQYLGPVLLILPILTFLGGLLVGNRLAIGRDRRRERNVVAQRLRVALLNRGGLDRIDTDLYLQMLSFWPRWRFRRAVERHQKATADHQYDPNYGTAVFTASAAAELKSSTDALLRHTRQR